jgi:cytosine/adenosine deaminase-related metal-dependent hydrolase
MGMALVLHGPVVTLDPERPLLDDGAVYVGEGGRIDAVQEAGAPAPAGFAGAARIAARGTIYPGLIGSSGGSTCIEQSPPGGATCMQGSTPG